MGSATGNSMLGDMERNRLICQEMPVNQRSCLLQIRNDVRDLLNRLPEGGQSIQLNSLLATSNALEALLMLQPEKDRRMTQEMDPLRRRLFANAQ